MHKFTSGTIFRMLCLIVMACSDPDDIEPVDCSLSDLSVIISGTENVSACNTTDGTVSVSATGGKAPYQFSINDGSLIDGDADGQHRFTQLSPGTYTVHVIDANGCETNSEATVGAEGSTLAVSVIPEEDTECITGNGKITVEVTGGVPPLPPQHRFGNLQ